MTAPFEWTLSVGASPAMPGVVAGLTRFTRPFSFLGFPALAQPIGFSSAGLPLSMQLVGRPFAEHRLLEIGIAYETAARTGRRLPELNAVAALEMFERSP